MSNKRIILILVSIIMTGILLPVDAVRYTILYVNTKTITIGNRVLKAGDSYDDFEEIKWSSYKQAIKVRNEETKRTRVITKQTISNKSRQSLKEYLVNKKLLSTRSYSIPVQLLDTLVFNIEDISKGSMKYIALWSEGDIKVRTSLPLSEDGSSLYITRNIFGHHKPQRAFISILKYDLRTNQQPDSLGYLHIEPLPLSLP